MYVLPHEMYLMVPHDMSMSIRRLIRWQDYWFPRKKSVYTFCVYENL